MIVILNTDGGSYSGKIDIKLEICMCILCVHVRVCVCVCVCVCMWFKKKIVLLFLLLPVDSQRFSPFSQSLALQHSQ